MSIKARGVLKVINDKFMAGGKIIQGIFFMIILVLFFVSIFKRSVLGSDLVGMEELVMFFAVWLYMLGAGIGTYEDTHISADLIKNIIKSPRGKLIHRIYIYLVNSLIAGYFLKLTWDWIVWSSNLNPLSTVLRFPMIFAYISILVGFIFIFIYSLMHLYNTMIKLIKKDFVMETEE